MAASSLLAILDDVSVLAKVAAKKTTGVLYGLYLSQRPAAWQRSLGRAILAGAPWIMKMLSIVGTAAMFMVGGGIVFLVVSLAERLFKR